MADYFYDGMPNVNERLNLLYTAFAAGPYNALPLTGGALTGPVSSSSSLSATSIIAGTVAAAAWASALLRPNGLVGGVGGVLYPALSVGVASVPGLSNSGRFLLSTGSVAGGTGGYILAVSFQDAGTTTETGSLLSISGAGNLTVAGRVSAANIVPIADNTHTVGTAALAYATLYARTGTINTSDARLKCDFRDLTAAEIAAAKDIARAIGAYRWRDAVDCKGPDAREHVGPTVQRAIEIMQAHGLDPFNYGFICHDTWEQQTIEHPAIEARPAIPATEAAPEVRNSFGDIITPAVPASDGQLAVEARAAYTEVTLEAGDRYAFRYEELAMFIAAGQEARLAALEAA
ncbi:hypothetical protein ABIE30_000630 [Janthinobacterium lividum]|uniref:tail fiber domain-containing protein n=1 Tax=Janthinobacterium lividum TaxID=29581 RepID=UPI003D223F23